MTFNFIPDSHGSTASEELVLRGRVWIFGDDISTDLMMPGSQVLAGKGLDRPAESWCLHAIRPEWSSRVTQGDIMIAGKNFGCGSGRNAPSILKKLGIIAIVADSVSRTFFRNAVNNALPALDCIGCRDIFAEGDIAEIHVHKGTVRNFTAGAELAGAPIPADSPPGQIIQFGGFEAFIIAATREKLAIDTRTQ